MVRRPDAIPTPCGKSAGELMHSEGRVHGSRVRTYLLAPLAAQNGQLRSSAHDRFAAPNRGRGIYKRGTT
jgi:hypothetical protein